RKYLSVVENLLLLILTGGRSARSNSQCDHCNQSEVRAPLSSHVLPPSRENRNEQPYPKNLLLRMVSKLYWNYGSLCADEVCVKPLIESHGFCARIIASSRDFTSGHSESMML